MPCKTVPSTAIPNVVPEVKTSTLVIAMTFDDGPDPEGTPAVLQVLSKHQAKATFFMIGKQAEKYPDLVRRVHLEGHEIGNHGYLHSYSLYRNVSKAMKDIEETQNLIYRLTGRRPALYRPPGGYISEELALALAKKASQSSRGLGYKIPKTGVRHQPIFKPDTSYTTPNLVKY